MNNALTNKLTLSLKDAGILIVFLALVATLWAVSPDHQFLSLNNILLILIQTAINGILAMGMMYVIISGEIDLSVGSTIALSGVTAAMLAHPGQFPLIVPIVAGIAIGTVVGLVNGVGVAYGAIPSFIITLGSMTAVRGLALMLSGGAPVFDVSSTFEAIASVRIGRFPIMAVYFIVIAALFAFIIHRTVYGRRLYAVGGNLEATRLSGINTGKVLVFVYAMSGLFAALAGLIVTARLSSAQPTAGASYELDAIAAVVVGGTSLMGGKGKITGTLIGALIIGFLNNALNLLDVSAYYQTIAKSIVILVAVLADNYLGRKTA